MPAAPKEADQSPGPNWRHVALQNGLRDTPPAEFFLQRATGQDHRAERNQEAAAREEARQRERLRREIGDDAYRGLEALAECKHTVAIAYAERAQEDSDIEYMLAGYWLEIMTVAETDGEAAAGKLLPILVARDPKLTSTEQAATLVGEAMEELRDIRAQYGMAVSCA